MYFSPKTQLCFRKFAFDIKLCLSAHEMWRWWLRREVARNMQYRRARLTSTDCSLGFILPRFIDVNWTRHYSALSSSTFHIDPRNIFNELALYNRTRGCFLAAQRKADALLNYFNIGPYVLDILLYMHIQICFFFFFYFVASQRTSLAFSFGLKRRTTLVLWYFYSLVCCQHDVARGVSSLVCFSFLPDAQYF